MVVVFLFINTKTNILHTNQIAFFIYWMISFLLLWLLVGFNKDKHIYKKNSLELVFIYTNSYLLLIYILGIIFGYTTNPYERTFIKIISNSFFVILTIIIQEFFRYIVISKNNKLLILLTTFIFILFDFLLGLKLYNLNNPLDIFKLLSIILIPSISRNFLLSYLTYKVGYISSILYRVVLKGYIYILPIFPDLGLYLDAILSVLLPLILFFKIDKEYRVVTINNNSSKRSLKMLLTVPLLLFSIGLVLLVSGKFKYTIMAIGSNSMYPSLKVGDAVVYKSIKKSELNTINTDDVLVYINNNKTVIHRIIEIKNINNQYTFYTKGDNNKEKDNYVVLENSVIGISQFKIPFIGFPSVWLSKMIR